MLQNFGSTLCAIPTLIKHTLHSRLDGKSVIELLLLLKSLGMHSITPLELKNLVALLKDQFPYKSHVIHVLSSMSKGKETNFHIFFLIIFKGQLISKCPFGVFKSTKKPRFFKDFCPSL